MKIFSIAYFSPIFYYAHWVNSPKNILEINDNFQKQTYRNRCYIYGGNGKLMLNIPTMHNKSKPHINIKEVQICNQQDWQKNHWKSICSAYKNSPFFEFYADDLQPVFKKKEKFLLDLNLKIHNIICSILEIDIPFETTEKYFENHTNILDLRNSIHPKKITKIPFEKYTQVFSDKLDFIPNLSILDLIFCEGNNAIYYLENINL